LPKRSGPKHGHKLTREVLLHIEQRRRERPNLRAGDLLPELQRTFGLTIHRRSLERLLSGKKNFRTAKSGRLFGDAAGYEKLRSCALRGTTAQGLAGLGVLLRRGLAAWLTASKLAPDSLAMSNSAPPTFTAARSSRVKSFCA
jgi:hypothetical protein